jgi:NADH:ubiquinone oxidoreductase subunit 6 (subunit J)
MSSNQTNNAFKTQKSQTSPFFTIAIALMHLFALVLLVAFVGIGLIAVYHTVILLVSKALPLLTTFVVPSVTLVLAVGVHYLKQPTHNLLCLIAVFFMTVFLYLRVGAEFLGFLFLIVYVGAIAILFLFVIMLLNLKKQDLSPKHSLGFNRETLVRFSVLLPIAGLDDIASTEIAKFFIISDVVSMKTENNSVDAVA